MLAVVHRATYTVTLDLGNSVTYMIFKDTEVENTSRPHRKKKILKNGHPSLESVTLIFLLYIYSVLLKKNCFTMRVNYLTK